MTDDICNRLAEPFDPAIIAAFMDKVEPEPNSGCWIWTGSRNKQGYGNFWLNKRCEKAHRVSHRIFIGPIPAGLDILHRCDMPWCVNPEHIRAGTTKENMADMYAKGRSNPPKRERNSHAVMTAAGAQWVKDLAELCGYGTAEISRRMGISTSQVRRILRRECWGPEV